MGTDLLFVFLYLLLSGASLEPSVHESRTRQPAAKTLLLSTHGSVFAFKGSSCYLFICLLSFQIPQVVPS